MDISHLTIWNCTPNYATLAAQIPAIPSQIQIFSKHSITYRQKADAVSSQSQSQSHQELATKLSQFFWRRLCNVLGEPLQLIVVKRTKLKQS